MPRQTVTLWLEAPNGAGRVVADRQLAADLDNQVMAPAQTAERSPTDAVRRQVVGKADPVMGLEQGEVRGDQGTARWRGADRDNSVD